MTESILTKKKKKALLNGKFEIRPAVFSLAFETNWQPWWRERIVIREGEWRSFLVFIVSYEAVQICWELFYSWGFVWPRWAGERCEFILTWFWELYTSGGIVSQRSPEWQHLIFFFLSFFLVLGCYVSAHELIMPNTLIHLFLFYFTQTHLRVRL